MRASATALALAIVLLAGGCAERVEPPPAPPAVAEPPPLRTKPGTATRDFNGDGFIDAEEAAGYYARRFGELDQDGDVLLSEEEIAADMDAGGFAELDLDADLSINQDEYFQSNSRRFRSAIDPTTGMMSTSDFDTMIGRTDPIVVDGLDPSGS